jgi:hypothetical protein
MCLLLLSAVNQNRNGSTKFTENPQCEIPRKTTGVSRCDTCGRRDRNGLAASRYWHVKALKRGWVQKLNRTELSETFISEFQKTKRIYEILLLLHGL